MLLIWCSQSFAGGPLATRYGKPITHNPDNFPITYHVDLGTLGPLSNAEATALVDNCFSQWGNVSTATISFANAGYLPVDVTADNYGVYWNSNDGKNPIVFDTNGSIMDAVYGIGGSASILGFASFSIGSTYIGEAFVVLNGVFASVPGNPGVLKATIVHELGHFAGLDHSQINTELAQNGIKTDDRYVPTMFPFYTDNDSSVAELNPDDEAALTLLYPEDAATVDSVYGKISGSVKRADGSPVLGANVVAVMIGNEEMNRFSSVSDYYQLSNGAFEMYVLPGTYKVFIEPVNTDFTGGSSVGPYSEVYFPLFPELSSPSFVDPVTTEYYNGAGENAYELDLNAYSEITVTAGEEVDGIDFVAESDGFDVFWDILLEILYDLIPFIFDDVEISGNAPISLSEFIQLFIYILFF